jgi:hypothetical protein
MNPDTQTVLDALYTQLTAQLSNALRQLARQTQDELGAVERLCRELGVQPVSSERGKRLQDVEAITWRPIAQTCMVSLLRSIAPTESDSPSDSTLIPDSTLKARWESTLDESPFAASIGLSTDDARLARRLCCQVVLESPALQKPVVFKMDSVHFSVERRLDRSLCVSRIRPADKKPSFRSTGS